MAMAISMLQNVISVLKKQELSPQANAARMVTFAEKYVADLISSGKASADYTVSVDGTRTKDVSQARESLVYEFHYLDQVVQFALEQLRKRSQSSGPFGKSFYASFDGTFYAPEDIDIKAAQNIKEAVLGNTQAYNRKIDVQMSGSKALHYSVPTGLYDDVVRAINRKFGKMVIAKRVPTYSFDRMYKRRKPGREFQSPAIVISLRR